MYTGYSINKSFNNAAVKTVFMNSGFVTLTIIPAEMGLEGVGPVNREIRRDIGDQRLGKTEIRMVIVNVAVHRPDFSAHPDFFVQRDLPVAQ